MDEGRRVGPYVVRRHLGDGGMGSVWLADDTRLHRKVALKTLKAARNTDTAGRERLMREARAAAALNHPNIAAVYDVIEVDGDVAIVFEYVEGITLASSLRNGAWPIDRAVQTAIQLTSALSAAHAQGIVHRDLKPSNVIIGPGDTVKVLDFGIARAMSTGTTETLGSDASSVTGFAGTPAYAAPEQLVSSSIDERADLYALGVVLFEMTTGRRPFPGNDAVALAAAKLGDDAPSAASTGALVPAGLDRLIGRLLARRPDERPSSAAEVRTSLRAIAGETGTGPLAAARPWARWSTAAAALAVAVLTIAVGAAVMTVAVPRDTRAADPETPVVAVLPLRNTSGDPSKDYLAAGLSESLITGLASSPSLVVLSRAAVADAIRNDATITDAIKVMNAHYVVDGSLQQSGGQLRVAVNLIRANQSIAWGRTFDGTADRIFDLQTRMALALSEALSAGRPASNPAATTQPRVLEAYWRGRAFLDRWDIPGNVDSAIASMTEAIEGDPNFALGHAGLGLAYWQKYSDTRDQQFARLAAESGAKAAQLDPDQPEVRYALAVTLAGTGRRDEAIAELKQALAIRPTFDEARRRLAHVLAAEGQVDEAVTEFQRAIALRPRYWGGYSEMGLVLLNAARYQEAARAFEQVVALQPDSNVGYQQLGAAYQMLNETNKAIAAYERALAIRPSWGSYSNLGMLQHIRGEYAKAVGNYQQALKLQPNLASLHRNLGDSYLRMGRTEEARKAYLMAIERAEADIAVNPKSGRGHAALAVYEAKAGRTADAVKRISTALTLAADDVQVRYRAAVVNSLAGRQDEALNQIAAAIERGYSVRAAVEDEDLAGLRDLPRFKQLVTRQQPR